MLYLGDWQLRRAEAGNALSWAYTFEWPIFAICGVAFWVKSLREELGPQASQQSEADAAEVGETDADYLARLKAEVQGHGRWHGIR
jgi:hypothetical protein